MALGFFEIFAIVVAGIIGVVSIVGCCIACICGGNPLCCLGVGVLATLGLSKPRRERQALVIHHAQGYDTTTAQTHLQLHVYRPHIAMLPRPHAPSLRRRAASLCHHALSDSSA